MPNLYLISLRASNLAKACRSSPEAEPPEVKGGGMALILHNLPVQINYFKATRANFHPLKPPKKSISYWNWAQDRQIAKQIGSPVGYQFSRGGCHSVSQPPGEIELLARRLAHGFYDCLLSQVGRGGRKGGEERNLRNGNRPLAHYKPIERREI